jgi:hypothetical protein
MSPKALAVIQRIYDEVHAALWALLGAGLLLFLVVILPTLPAHRANAERLRALQIAAENRNYCEKWGMLAGTRRYAQCMLDLGELRISIARQLADDLSF